MVAVGFNPRTGSKAHVFRRVATVEYGFWNEERRTGSGVISQRKGLEGLGKPCVVTHGYYLLVAPRPLEPCHRPF
jgi:hypothetical protein